MNLDQYTDAELRQLLAATNSMTTYRAVRRLLDRRAQERAAKRRAEREKADRPEAEQVDYLRRCNRLGGRGLSDRLVRDLRKAGDFGLLREVEGYDEAHLARLNALHEQRAKAKG